VKKETPPPALSASRMPSSTQRRDLALAVLWMVGALLSFCLSERCRVA
jgi:hypothetical protein